MRTIEYAEALAALNEAVKTKGHDFVYAKRLNNYYCYNVWEGQPDCIVGHALVYLGVPVEWFSAASSETPDLQTADVGDVCKTLLLQDRLAFTDEAKDLLAGVQVEQDSGTPWGVAVARTHLGEEDYLKFCTGRV